MSPRKQRLVKTQAPGYMLDQRSSLVINTNESELKAYKTSVAQHMEVVSLKNQLDSVKGESETLRGELNSIKGMLEKILAERQG